MVVRLNRPPRRYLTRKALTMIGLFQKSMCMARQPLRGVSLRSSVPRHFHVDILQIVGLERERDQANTLLHETAVEFRQRFTASAPVTLNATVRRLHPVDRAMLLTNGHE